MTTPLETMPPGAPRARRALGLPWTDRRVLLAGMILLIGALLLAQRVGPAVPGEDSADVGFARDMMAHHNQAVQMADILRIRSSDEVLRPVATEIVLVQQFQIGYMQSLLEQWGKELNGDAQPMTWMGAAVPTWRQMPGMATDEEIRALEQLPIAESEVQFVRLMIRHHLGGIMMAEAAVTLTEVPKIRDLASAIAQTQRFEISQMQQLLDKRGQPREPETLTTGAHGGMEMESGHAEGGFFSSFAAAARDTNRLLPLTLAAFAGAWLALILWQRRYAGAPATVVVSGLRLAAAAGLLVTAAIHVGLTPEHLEEMTAYGIFFAVSGVLCAAIAAGVVLSTDRRWLMAGAAVTAALIVVYLVFRFVPPPGSDEAEAFDFVGLLTKVVELATLLACVTLLRRPERAPTPVSPQSPAQGPGGVPAGRGGKGRRVRRPA